MKSVMKFIVALFVVSQLHAQVEPTRLMIAATGSLEGLEKEYSLEPQCINKAIWVEDQGCYKTTLDCANDAGKKDNANFLHNKGGRTAAELLGKGRTDCQGSMLDLTVSTKSPHPKHTRTRG